MVEKVSVVTLGCEKNLVDSEIMSGLVHQRGFKLVEKPEDATVVIVNTCGFIDAAKEESVNTILNLAELKETARLKALIVSGCLTQRYKKELMDEMPEIDGIVGTGDFFRINDIIDEALRGAKPVYVGKLKVQMIAEYRGQDLTGKVLRIENTGDAPTELTERTVAPASALAVSIAEPKLDPGKVTTAYLVSQTVR